MESRRMDGRLVHVFWTDVPDRIFIEKTFQKRSRGPFGERTLRGRVRLRPWVV